MNISILLKQARKFSFYIVIFLVALGEVLFASTILPNQWNKIQDDQAQLKILNVEISDLVQTLDFLNSMDKTKLQENLLKAKAALPDEKKTSGLVTGLSNLAGTSGVTVKNLDFSPGLISTKAGSLAKPNPAEEIIKGGGIRTVSGTMTVIFSQLSQLIDFLQKMNRASQLLGVSDLSYTSQAISGNQANIGLYIYYQPPKQTTLLWRQAAPLTPAENKILDALGSKDLFILQ